MRFAFLALGLFVCVPFQAALASEVATVAQAQASQEAVLKKLESDEFDYVRSGHRQKIAALQEELSGINPAGGSEADARAVALVGEIDDLMTDAQLDRPVCAREKVIGSNRMARVCRTRRQMQAQAEAARRGG